MTRLPIEVLVVEDSQQDFLLLERALKVAGMNARCERVASRDDLVRALEGSDWHVALSDYSLPGLPFHDVLETLKSRRPDLPLILVSGAIGEEEAVRLLKDGLADFVLKDRVARLATAVERSLKDAAAHQDRIATGAALRAAEERQRLALDAAGLGTWTGDMVTDRYDVDARAMQHLGLRSGRVTRAAMIAHVHAEDAARIGSALRTLQAETGEDGRFTFEYRVVRSDGSIRWIADRGQLRFTGEGAARRAVEAVGTTQDVTERKLSELRLREREERLDLALTAAHMGVWEWNIAPDALFLSPQALSILRLERFAGRSRDFFKMMHPDDHAAVRAALDRALLDRTRYSAEFRVCRPDQSIVWLTSLAYAKYDVHGHPVRVIGTIADVSEAIEARAELEAHRLQLESLVATRTEELRQQASYLQALIDHLPFRAWLKDTRRNYLTLNRRTAAARGLSVQEVVGRGDVDIDLWDAVLSAQRHEVDGEVLASRRSRTVEASLSSSDRAEWLEIYSAPVLDDKGEALGTVGFARDITDQHAANLAREQALAEARRLARARSDFVANMSHEIRTPLNAVLGLAQVGVRANAGRQTVATFERILDAGRHLLGIINDILDFSKIEAGKLQVQQEPFSVGGVIDQAVRMIATQAAEKGLGLIVTETRDLLGVSRGDELRLAQILVNLLSNAVKFTTRGSVSLSAHRETDSLVFVVSDTGIGMSNDEVGRLFRPFEQADGSTTRRFGGTGLGLAISERLARLMGGGISVTSRPDAGSRFEVRVHAPVVEPGPTAHAVTVALAGLPADEMSRAAAQLGAFGAQVRIVAPDSAFALECDVALVTPERLADADTARILAQRGKRVVVAGSPGTVPSLGDVSLQDIVVIERPIRARHVLGLDGAPNAVGAGTDAPCEQRLPGLRVLVAEDSEVNRLVLSEMLSGEGARLTMAENGRLALEHFRESGLRTFDIALTDVQMPEMDGYEFARRLRAEAPGLPVIGLTAHAMPEERGRCLAAGMVDYLTKPVELDRLVSVLRRHAQAAGTWAATEPSRTLVPDRTAASPAPAGRSPLDWEAVAARFKGKREFVQRLARTFIDTHGSSPERIRQAVLAGDLETLAAVAHAVKGIVGNFLLDDLEARARHAEAAAMERHPGVAESAEALAKGIEDLLGQLVAEVD
ncbi:MAG: response regulator [Burkholderiales bacterium]